MEVRSTESFLRYWRSIHTRSRRVIELIPSDRLDWTPTAGKWTLGDLVRHLATIERFMFVETASGRSSSFAGQPRSLAEDLESTLELYDRLHAESVAIVGSFPDARLRERCTTPAGAEIAVGKWLRAMIEHEVHHRAQIYLLLGQLDVATPPLFGLTAEQVAARAGAADP